MRYGRNTAEVERLLGWLAEADATVARTLIAGNEVRRTRIADGDLYGDVLRYTARTKEEVLALEPDRKAVFDGLVARAGIESAGEQGEQLRVAISVASLAVAARDLVTPGEFAIIVAPVRDAGYRFGDFASPPADYGPNQAEVERFFAWARAADSETARAIVTAEQHPLTLTDVAVRQTVSEHRSLADLPTAFVSRDVRATTSALFTTLGDGSDATRGALRSGLEIAANAVAKRHVLTADEFEIATRSVRAAGHVLDLTAPRYEPVDAEVAEVAPGRYGPNTTEIARLIAWIAQADRGTGLAILQAADAQRAVSGGLTRVPGGLPKLSAAQSSALDSDRNSPLVGLGHRTLDDHMTYARAQLRSVLTTAISAVASRNQLPPEDFAQIVAPVTAAGYDFG